MENCLSWIERKIIRTETDLHGRAWTNTDGLDYSTPFWGAGAFFGGWGYCLDEAAGRGILLCVRGLGSVMAR